MYPKIGQPGQSGIPFPARAPPYQYSSDPPSSSGTGIRVQIKPSTGSLFQQIDWKAVKA